MSTNREAWTAAYELGEKIWSGVSLDPEHYRLRGEGMGIDPTAPSFSAGDFWLACACLQSDREAISALESVHIRPARGAIARVRNDESFIDDICQDLRKKLLTGPQPRLSTYRGRGSLRAWVRVVATRLAIQVAIANENESAPLRGGDLVEKLGSFEDPQIALLRTRYLGSFQVHLSAALEDLTPFQRNLLRMSLLDGLSIDEIAKPYRVHRATAARWLRSARVQILQTLKSRMAAMHAELDSEEFLSVGRAIRSQLNLSLSRVLTVETRP